MAQKHEFVVVIDGISLNEDEINRMSDAVSQAASSALAGADLRGDFASMMLAGNLRGRAMLVLSPEQSAALGLPKRS